MLLEAEQFLAQRTVEQRPMVASGDPQSTGQHLTAFGSWDGDARVNQLTMKLKATMQPPQINPAI